MKLLAYIIALIIIGGFFVADLNAEKKDSHSISGFKNSNPVEIGLVDWNRNYDQSIEIASKEKKPVLILFQEVPGCSTASGYGKNVLTHPLIIDAIETEFVPLAIYNNEGGHDKEILDSFNEPSWNNPVVRIITPEKKALSPRLSGDYTKFGLIKNINLALDNKTPEYLKVLEQEFTAKNSERETAIFAMHCFWTGEGRLGAINGVLSTEPGFMGGREVVKVEYNPKVISFEKLLNTAKKNRVASHVYTNNNIHKKLARKIIGENSVSNIGTFRADNEPKYYMSKTPYRFIPMTPLQVSRVNSAIGFRQSPDKFLSERQIQLLNYIKSNPDKNWESQIENKDFITAWNQTFSLVETKTTKK